MPVIDIIILRLAIYELISRAEVPTAVVLNEAVELAKTFRPMSRAFCERNSFNNCEKGSTLITL